jgi:tripartite-type tricarboxylate transporter receptor subunit TctC
VRPLAVTAEARVPGLPEVPTTAEAGLPDFVANAFFTLAAPASTPEPLLEALNADARAALADPPTRQRLVELGTTPRGLTVPEIRAYFAAETERWTRVIAAAGLRAD